MIQIHTYERHFFGPNTHARAEVLIKRIFTCIWCVHALKEHGRGGQPILFMPPTQCFTNSFGIHTCGCRGLKTRELAGCLPRLCSYTQLLGTDSGYVQNHSAEQSGAWHFKCVSVYIYVTSS